MPSRWRVPAGHAAFILVVALARPTLDSLAASLPFVLAGEAIRIWASGHIEKTRALATGGPYAHSRNPLYFGSLLLGVGVGMATASPWPLVATILYFAAFYPSVIVEEGHFLSEKFPEEYEAWAREVPLFLPRLTPGGPRATRFSWSLVGRNREWRTAFGLVAAIVLLWLRGRYLPRV
jgi:protein-S-isoprenylcysteine O-methyltransferase Ste14